ncbi:hypothetical protein AAur_3572 [Paenarthrobacter aurescens TC1]|uniref:Uncharacterized protein n=1 Tax=Paenarthrobacter aurescens (strain TC1) TaxID=290340 RepID=A1RAK3_PAEAT|nr:hypothetical protein AAur_3572 [Paenarthrobacter aurescens TC1]
MDPPYSAASARKCTCIHLYTQTGGPHKGLHLRALLIDHDRACSSALWSLQEAHSVALPGLFESRSLNRSPALGDSTSGWNRSNITNGLGIAGRMVNDLRELEPDAWVFWQPVEDTYKQEKADKGWGSIYVDFDCNYEGRVPLSHPTPLSRSLSHSSQKSERASRYKGWEVREGWHAKGDRLINRSPSHLSSARPRASLAAAQFAELGAGFLEGRRKLAHLCFVRFFLGLLVQVLKDGCNYRLHLGGRHRFDGPDGVGCAVRGRLARVLRNTGCGDANAVTGFRGGQLLLRGTGGCRGNKPGSDQDSGEFLHGSLSGRRPFDCNQSRGPATHRRPRSSPVSSPVGHKTTPTRRCRSLLTVTAGK